jgi:exosome complex component RRP41
MQKKAEKLLVDGRRTDGRKPEELRPVSMEVGVVTRADGSAKVSFGKTLAVAAAYGPRALFPRFLQESETGILRCRYNMAPFSVDDRKSPGPDRRSVEISKVTRLAFQPAVLLEDFPKATVDIFIEILEADGSTRVTGINAASLALASAGVPMRDLVAACSVGKIDGELIVDLNGKEDNFGEADMAVAMLPSKNEISLLQMDGLLTKEEFFKLLQLAVQKCKEIYEMQKRVLKKVYEVEEVGE